MGSIIEIFDESKERYVAQEVIINNYSTMCESDYKAIEAALIKFAEDIKNAS